MTEVHKAMETTRTGVTVTK